MVNSLEIIKKLSLLLIGIIIALTLSESIFYLLPTFKQKYSLEKFVTSSPRLERMLNIQPYIYRPSNIIGYERVPHSAPNINSYGLIGKEFDIEKKDGIFRILILGDSLIEYKNYFVECLKELLKTLNVENNFEIINAGVGAYEAWHYARFLKYKGIKFNPDMVIVSLCLNDFYHPYEIYYKTKDGFTEFKVPARNTQNNIPINFFLFRHFYLYRLFIITLNNFFHYGKSSEDIIFDEGIIHMSEIKKICQDNKVSLFCFIWPYFMPYKEYTEDQKNEYRQMVKVLNHLNIDYIDLHPYIPDEIRETLRVDKSDFIHPKREGHKVAAEVIFKHLINKYNNNILVKLGRIKQNK